MTMRKSAEVDFLAISPDMICEDESCDEAQRSDGAALRDMTGGSDLLVRPLSIARTDGRIGDVAIAPATILLPGTHANVVVAGDVAGTLADYSTETGTQGIVVNLGQRSVVVGGATYTPGQAKNSYGLISTLSGVLDITGTAFDDVIYGSLAINGSLAGSGGNILRGGGGNDIIHASVMDPTGWDTVLGTADDPRHHQGADKIYGGEGNDTIYSLGMDATYLDGGAGDDVYYISHSARPGTSSAGPIRTTINDSSGYDVVYVVNGTVQANSLVGIEKVIIQEGGPYNVEFRERTLADLPITIIGNSWNNVLSGTGGKDSLYGGAGDDTLMGKSNGDILDGGSGFDTVSYLGTGFALFIDVMMGIVDGGAAGDQLISIENIIGSSVNDTLYGTNGANSLDGSGGADLMVGRNGDDYYIVDNVSDVVVELANQGTDTVRWEVKSNAVAVIGYILPDNVENLYAYVSSIANSFSLKGSGQDNRIQLEGGGGKIASLYGFEGNDVLISDGGGDYLDGGGGDDSLYGNYGRDTLVGGTGNDLLDGGVDKDSMAGGGGNDIYYVDNLADVVTEQALGGVDLVRTTLTNYTLAAEVENLTVLGDRGQACTGIGNAMGNIIISSGAGDDLLRGMDGADFIYGGSGFDKLEGGNGHDRLFGEAGNDQLDGGEGNDQLDGGAGTDTLTGGAGNDIYFLNDKNDTVVELANGGYDAIYTTMATWTLSGEIEALFYIGTGTFTGIGRALADSIYGGVNADLLQGMGGNDYLAGGGGADTLQGGEGNDILFGGLGKDVLTGGGGADIFYFAVEETEVRSIGDRITDFAIGVDKIDLRDIDANVADDEDNAFVFIGSAAFSGTAGQLRCFVNGGDTQLQGDINGDGVADFTIVLTGNLSLGAGDFLL